MCVLFSEVIVYYLDSADSIERFQLFLACLCHYFGSFEYQIPMVVLVFDIE